MSAQTKGFVVGLAVGVALTYVWKQAAVKSAGV